MNTWKKRGMQIAAVIVTASAFIGLIRIIITIQNKMQQEIEEQKVFVNQYIKKLQIMNEWIKIKTNNRSISDYLAEMGYHTVAIYGMEGMGDCLLNELRHGNITVKYAIDKNAEKIYTQVDLYTPNDDLPEVDAIVSTDLMETRNIRKQLKCNKQCPVLSLEEIIMEL